MAIPYSLLDLVPVKAGSTAAQAFRDMADLARRAEALGYQRYWLAEHHSHPGVASVATVVLIEHVLSVTRTIRVGSGGIMLPNHAPLMVAEQFGTLATLHPGRVDLGLGRAPGTDQRTAHALRRNLAGGVDHFPQDVIELQRYLAKPGQDPLPVRALPGEGTEVPLYILGSSLYGAELAALLGLPFAAASHFSPETLVPAMALYREKFRPSRVLQQPYAIAAVNVVAAESGEQAFYLLTSWQQHFININHGDPRPLEPPVEDIADFASPADLARLRSKLAGTVVGDREQIRTGLQEFRARSGANELIFTAMIYDHEARCRSFEIAAEVAREL